MADFSPVSATTASLIEKQRPGWRVALRWALIGLALHFAIVVLNGRVTGEFWFFSREAPEWFVHFGTKYKVVDLATIQLGHRPSARDELGHDGQWFWLLAHDPLMRNAEEMRRMLDRPAYRAQRVGYPLIAGLWLAAGGERSLLWGMIVTNLIAVAVGGYLAALLLIDLGARPWMAITFGLVPGVLYATLLDLADGWALMWLVAMLLAVQRQRWTWAVIAAVAAALTKEVMLLSVFGVALLSPGLARAQRSRLIFMPLIAVAAWGLYLRYSLGWQQPRIKEITWPLAGFIESARLAWMPLRQWVHAGAAVAMLVLAWLIVMRWNRRRSLLLAGAVPIACLVPFLGTSVIALGWNGARAASPAILLWLLSLSPRQAATA